MTASNGAHRKNSPANGVSIPSKFQYSSSSSDDDDDYVNYGYSCAAETESPVLDPRDQNTADNWIPRNPSLVRLTGKHPFNAEAPLKKLMDSGFITPVPLHYVRNHGPVPKSTWEEWTIEVTGLVTEPTRFTMTQLVTEFPSKEFPVTLVCAGNRRKEQNMVKQTIGFNWGAAGVSTSVWRGVPLRDVLKRCGIMGNRKGALNVCFEGAENLPGGGGSKYGTSLRKEVAMDPARDIILAYMQNGERLTPDHGFPMRIIIPGFIGGRMVKWLKRITVTTAESDNYYHYKDNRVFPSSVDAELANSQGWWYRPEYIINELNVNSVITTPCHDEMLHIHSGTAQGSYSLRGYAYSGGGRRVTRVEVSMDGGDTWQVCTLDRPEKPNKYGKYWCWCFWNLEVEILELLRAKEIAVRAWDEALNTQPENHIWNLMGMMNNCWFRVKVNVRKVLGEITIIFEHPTLPGNETGGWMAKEVNQENKNVSSTPVANGPSDVYSVSEVQKHTSADSAWIIVHGLVYNCTRFLKDHPGGTDSILINAGSDCTEEFDAIHSVDAKKMLDEYRIGKLASNEQVQEDVRKVISSPLATIKGKNVALVLREKFSCKLVAKKSLTQDVRLFRFELPDREQLLGLPVGKHIFLCATIEKKVCIRAYTPSSDPNAVGYLEIVVKIYFKGTHPDFPDGGLMSQHLETLELGSFIDVKGPFGHIEYTGKGNFLVHGKRKYAKQLAMIAGGTGITPIYQVMQAIMSDPEDRTEMHLVYANRTEEDILLRKEMDCWAEKYPDKLKVWYVVSENVKQGWKYSVGIVDGNVLREHIPVATEYTLALACGPPGMLKCAVKPNLESMGYDTVESLLVF